MRTFSIYGLTLVFSLCLSPQIVQGDVGDGIDAETLYMQYEENEIAAEAKYKGRRIVVFGEIVSVGNNVAGQPTVTLNAGSFKFISCRLPNDKAESLIKLRKGDEVGFVCTAKAKILTTVHLSDCEIDQ